MHRNAFLSNLPTLNSLNSLVEGLLAESSKFARRILVESTP